MTWVWHCYSEDSQVTHTSFSLPLISGLIGQLSNLRSAWKRASMLSSVCLFGPQGPQPMRLLCPWDYGVCCHFLLQGIYLTQGSNLIFLHLLLWQTDSLSLSLLGNLVNTHERRIWSITAVSVQFSCSVLSDSLWPHGLQYTRLPCPSPTPGACSNSCPLSW